METSSQRAQASRFLRALHVELSKVLVPEMELTVRVAVLSAAGYTRPQIVERLACTDLEVKMCMLRLQKMAGSW